ncbi:MAG TPA: isoprenylcysteine carboxylmethyltransferase family protein [Pirellulales bacterium]|nr:isoprenylcysteine carboxylmethyltransferase family protein [Pirellulales bacterium]
MNQELPFRVALLVVVVASVTIVALHYIGASVAGERVSRNGEGLLMLVSLRLAGLVLFAATMAYLVNPRWMIWAAVPLANAVRWLGAAVDLLGIVLLAWTLRTLGRNLTDTVTTRPQHSLVTTGPYRWVRHPYYSTTLLLVGGAGMLAANSLIGVLGLVVFGLLVMRTPSEEQMLIDRFGDEYRAYMGRTGRFVPRLR